MKERCDLAAYNATGFALPAKNMAWFTMQASSCTVIRPWLATIRQASNAMMIA